MKTLYTAPPNAHVVSRQTLDTLAAFCASQRYCFDPAAWLQCSVSHGRLVAVVAQYLAMTSWYGHESELQAIAEKIFPGISSLDAFHQETSAMEMNLALFSVSTRCKFRIASRMATAVKISVPVQPLTDFAPSGYRDSATGSLPAAGR